MLNSIGKKYSLKAKDSGSFAKIKVSGMNFTIESYEAVGLGHVSVMKAKGFFGLMKMDTVIINPTEVDMPLLSYDRVLAMGNDTLIIEIYDTLLENCDLASLAKVKDEYAELPEHDLGSHWYDSIKLPQSVSKKGKKKLSPEFEQLVESYLNTYLETAAHAKKCSSEEKREKASIYVEGLLEHGGPSTDVFKKHFGEEKTAELFRKVLFGTTTA